MKPLTIPAAKADALRVFSVSKPVPDIAGSLAKTPKADIAAALLGRPVDENKVELFAVSDLAGIGLPGYLIEGQGVDPDEVTPDLAKLGALEGFVLILLPRAFGDQDVTLPCSPELTLIGTYNELEADMSAAPIDTASAELYSGVPTADPIVPPKGRVGSALVVLALIALALLALWWGVS